MSTPTHFTAMAYQLSGSAVHLTVPAHHWHKQYSCAYQCSLCCWKFLMLVILLCRLSTSGDLKWSWRVESGSVTLRLKSSEFQKRKRKVKQARHDHQLAIHRCGLARKVAHLLAGNSLEVLRPYWAELVWLSVTYCVQRMSNVSFPNTMLFWYSFCTCPCFFFWTFYASIHVDAIFSWSGRVYLGSFLGKRVEKLSWGRSKIRGRGGRREPAASREFLINLIKVVTLLQKDWDPLNLWMGHWHAGLSRTGSHVQWHNCTNAQIQRTRVRYKREVYICLSLFTRVGPLCLLGPHWPARRARLERPLFPRLRSRPLPAGLVLRCWLRAWIVHSKHSLLQDHIRNSW
jgi:hypothetical protein